MEKRCLIIELARRTSINLSLDGVDISEDINLYLQSLSYSDYSEDKSDDLQITIDDREHVWMNDWLEKETIQRGSTLRAAIIHSDNQLSPLQLDCGSFEIDSCDFSGYPCIVTIKATALPYSSTARIQAKTKAWEDYTLSGIANEIAAQNELKCMFLSDSDPSYTREEQVTQSDISFLQNLCKNADISLKATDKTIILFDRKAFEANPPIDTIKFGASDILSWRFSVSSADTSYKNSSVSYTDPETEETYSYSSEDENNKNSGSLNINEKVTSNEEAKILAQNRLGNKNKFEFTANFDLVGNVSLVASSNIEVSGFGAFDGKYSIVTAKHVVSSSGYRTSVELRKVQV